VYDAAQAVRAIEYCRVVHAQQLTGPVAHHGEGPVWSDGWGGLRFVDMMVGDVLSLAEDGSIGRRRVAPIAAAMRPRRSGGAIISVERGCALESADGSLTYLPGIWSDPDVRMNDGGCDPDGRFYCGSMAYDARPRAGALHRVDTDLSVSTVLDGVTISNGLEWTPDGSRAYYADTPTGRIDVFDYDTSDGLTGRRPFVEIPAGAGVPDGLTVDEEGGVWVALYDGGAVRRYTDSGVLDAVVEVPTRKVTACTFGGPDLGRLFITTSQENLEPGSDPLAGSLFDADVGVRGVPAREFAA
jgi:sugar lactone lactonase YvrE